MVWRLGGHSNVWLFWKSRCIDRSSWVWVYVSMPESECVWTAFGLVWDNRRLGLRQGHRWPCTPWQGDSRCASDPCKSCVWKQRRAVSPRQRVGVDNYILACSLNLKQTLENANNQIGKYKSLKSWNSSPPPPQKKKKTTTKNKKQNKTKKNKQKKTNQKNNNNILAH